MWNKSVLLILLYKLCLFIDMNNRKYPKYDKSPLFDPYHSFYVWHRVTQAASSEFISIERQTLLCTYFPQICIRRECWESIDAYKILIIFTSTLWNFNNSAFRSTFLGKSYWKSKSIVPQIKILNREREIWMNMSLAWKLNLIRIISVCVKKWKFRWEFCLV